jgi:hypothetical protein
MPGDLPCVGLVWHASPRSLRIDLQFAVETEQCGMSRQPAAVATRHPATEATPPNAHARPTGNTVTTTGTARRRRAATQAMATSHPHTAPSTVDTRTLLSKSG